MEAGRSLIEFSPIAVQTRFDVSRAQIIESRVSGLPCGRIRLIGLGIKRTCIWAILIIDRWRIVATFAVCVAACARAPPLDISNSVARIPREKRIRRIA